jgi:GNAT superfamily N-acetyltransferase
MFLVRRAVAADSPAIYDVHVGAITRVCAEVYTAQEIAGWIARKVPDGYVTAIGDNDFFVATDGERVVGFSEFNPGAREVAAVYVHPDFLRRGTGAALLDAAEAAARGRRVSDVHLRATLNAVPFYLRGGYTIEREGTVELGSGTLLRCVFMQKSLE